jgi:RNA polymerase sigma-70 factor (ECF subfamily)
VRPPDTDELVGRAASGGRAARDQLLRRCRGRLRRQIAVRLDRRLAARPDGYLRDRPLPFDPWPHAARRWYGLGGGAAGLLE